MEINWSSLQLVLFCVKACQLTKKDYIVFYSFKNVIGYFICPFAFNGTYAIHTFRRTYENTQFPR